MHDDNELMEKTKQGDDLSFEALVLKHRIRAMHFAYSYLMDIYLSEDIVQEAFAKVYINKENYKGSFSFRTYLYTIIRNLCIDEIRKNKNTGFIEEDVKSYFDVHSKIEETEKIKCVIKALRDLPNDLKTSLYLFSIEGLSHKEIAKITKKTIAQVKIYIYRARKKLKKSCKEVF